MDVLKHSLGGNPSFSSLTALHRTRPGLLDNGNLLSGLFGGLQSSNSCQSCHRGPRKELVSNKLAIAKVQKIDGKLLFHASLDWIKQRSIAVEAKRVFICNRSVSETGKQPPSFPEGTPLQEEGEEHVAENVRHGEFVLRSVSFLDVALVSTGLFGAGLSLQDAAASFSCMVGAYLLIRTFDELVRRNLLERKLSRKLVHISTGLLYFGCWPFFSGAGSARYYAALVPTLNVARMLAIGSGLIKDPGAVKSMSREGDPRELLRGPLYYASVLTLVTVCFWRSSPVGGIAVALMCGGDGIADIAGRRLGSAKLPWNEHKSWAGSVAMFLFGAPLALAAVYYTCSFGDVASCEWPATTARVALITLAATLVESLPITDKLDDNFTVPFTAIVLSALLFPSLPAPGP